MIFHCADVLDPCVVKLNGEFIEVRIVDLEFKIKIIIELISRRIVADPFAVLAPGVNLVSVLTDIERAGNKLRQRNDIRVFLAPRAGRKTGNHKGTVHGVNVDFFALAVDHGRIEGHQITLILFPVFKLFLDFING